MFCIGGTNEKNKAEKMLLSYINSNDHLLLILATIGVTSWNQTIEYSKFNEFATELQVLQSKVNELNQNKNIDIGVEITENQKIY